MLPRYNDQCGISPGLRLVAEQGDNFHETACAGALS